MNILNNLNTLPNQLFDIETVMFIIGITILIVILIIWSLAWKGLSLWKASHQNNKTWFIILLLVNTIGILDIIYYYLIDRKEKQPVLSSEIPS